jgi:hypothetical protein
LILFIRSISLFTVSLMILSMMFCWQAHMAMPAHVFGLCLFSWAGGIKIYIMSFYWVLLNTICRSGIYYTISIDLILFRVSLPGTCYKADIGGIRYLFVGAEYGGKNVLSVGSSICGSLNGKPADARGLLSGTALGVPLNNGGTLT